jgi:hypothetical protein
MMIFLHIDLHSVYLILCATNTKVISNNSEVETAHSELGRSHAGV